MLFLVVLQSIVRVGLWFLEPFSVPALLTLVNRFDCMMVGALGAIFYHRKHPIFMSVFDNKITQFVTWFILLTLILNKFEFLNGIIEVFVVELMTLSLIIGQIRVKNRLVNLDNGVMDYLGKLSYGIYVIHVLVIHFVVHCIDWTWIETQLGVIILNYLIVVVVTIVLAHLSYNYWEKPFLVLKTKFALVKSSGTKKYDKE